MNRPVCLHSNVIHVLSSASHYYTSMNEKLRSLLMLGLSQASADCWMPQCDLHPSHDIQEFFQQLDDKYPPHEYFRLLAHPLKPAATHGGQHDRASGDDGAAAAALSVMTFRRQVNNNQQAEDMSISSSGAFIPSVPFHRLQPPASWSLRPLTQEGADKSARHPKKKIVLAVGPEGGWSDAEISGFLAHGFVKVHMLGERVLRTDIAVRVFIAVIGHKRYAQDTGLFMNSFSPVVAALIHRVGMMACYVYTPTTCHIN